MGTVVRLRDSGRVGTVVGRKKGGWWVVDILETPGSDDGEFLDEGTIGSSAGSRPSTVSGSITTRRVNIEPLGDAYGPSEPFRATVDPGSDGRGALRERQPDGKASRNRKVGGAGVLVGDAEAAMLRAAWPEQAAALPRESVEPRVVPTLASHGLPHAAMKEWLVFSDLHVSPSSLAVSLEVRGRFEGAFFLPHFPRRGTEGSDEPMLAPVRDT